MDGVVGSVDELTGVVVSSDHLQWDPALGSEFNVLVQDLEVIGYVFFVPNEVDLDIVELFVAFIVVDIDW